MLLLRTFGGLSLENGGRPIVGAAGQPRRLAVLAVLAAAGDSGLNRDRLCALLWPDSDDERARGALKQALYAMRRDVQEQELVIGMSELRLNPAVITSDVGAFNTALAKGDLAAAVAHYTGPFLDGVHLRGESEFERWSDENRRALASKYANALESLTAEAMGRRDGAAAVEWARRLNAADALNTRAALLLMNALDAAGDRAGAIKHGELHARLLRAELEVEPGAEFAELLRRLREPRPASPRTAGVQREPAAPGSEQPPPIASVQADIAATPPERAEPPEPRVPPQRPVITPIWRRRTTALAAAVLVVAAVSLSLVFRHNGRAESEVVVVLPFGNDTGDSTFDRVGRMAADWIVQGLRQTAVVDVVDSRTAFGDMSSDARPQSLAESAAVAARRTGATMIVRGAIYRTNDSLSLHASIIRTVDARVLAELAPVTAPASDPRRLVEEAGQRVLGAFAALGDAHFGAWQNSVSAPPLYDAYLEFVRGLEDFVSMSRGDSAFAHFTAAARMDTSFVQAKLYVIETNNINDAERFRALNDSLLSAALRQRDRLTRFDRASLDRRVAEASADKEAMLVQSRVMMKLAPHSQDAHVWHAIDAYATNRFRESIEELHRERPRGHADTVTDGSIAPGGGFFERQDPLVHHLAGEYNEELAELSAWAALNPDNFTRCVAPARPLAALGRESVVDSILARCAALPKAMLGNTYWNTGREYRAHGHDAEAQRALLRARKYFQLRGETSSVVDFALGDWAQVRENWRDSAALRGNPVMGRAQLGMALAHLGDSAGARALVAAIERQRPDAGAVPGGPLLMAAMVEEALGNRSRALSLIQEAVSKGVPAAVQLHTHAATGFASMRDDPTFKAWLRERR